MSDKNIKNVTQRDHTQQRNFGYKRNNVQLAFTLRVDIKQELKDFLELLKVATEEVTAELEKMS